MCVSAQARIQLPFCLVCGDSREWKMHSCGQFEFIGAAKHSKDPKCSPLESYGPDGCESGAYSESEQQDQSTSHLLDIPDQAQ